MMNAPIKYEKMVTAKRNVAAGIEARRKRRLKRAARAVGAADRILATRSSGDFLAKRAASFEDRDPLVAKALRKLAKRRAKQARKLAERSKR